MQFMETGKYFTSRQAGIQVLQYIHIHVCYLYGEVLKLSQDMTIGSF